MKDITWFGWLFIVVMTGAVAAFFYAVITCHDEKYEACKARGWVWVQGRPPFCAKPGTVIQ